MKVLFLDIDGVLNGHDWDDEAMSCNVRRECVKRLNRVVAETGCRVVLSSAWRYIVHGGDMTLRGFGYMLRTHGLVADRAGRLFVGLTDEDAEPCVPGDSDVGERGRQCRKWLDDYAARPAAFKVSAFAAVDDEDHDFAASSIPAVITDGSRGLTDDDADRLIRLLNGEG